MTSKLQQKQRGAKNFKNCFFTFGFGQGTESSSDSQRAGRQCSAALRLVSQSSHEGPLSRSSLVGRKQIVCFAVVRIQLNENKSFFPHILFGAKGFLISSVSPRPRLQRQSLDIWPARRWAHFPHISFREVFFFNFFSPPPPRPQRQSANVWANRRWPQYRIPFAAWQLTLHRFWARLKRKVFFYIFFLLTAAEASDANSGRSAGQPLAIMRTEFTFCFGKGFMKN